MKTIILILIISINNFKSLSITNYIPYYQITNEAEWNYDQGNFGIAEKQLILAFDMDLTPKWKDVLLYVKILNRKPKRKEIYKTLLNQLQAKGGTTFKISEYLKKEKIKLSKSQYFHLDQYVLDSNSTIQKHLKFLNSCIDSMHYFDQEIRNKQRNNIDSVYIENKFLYILDAQEYIDSLNAQKLLSLFQNHELADFEIMNYKLSILLTHLDSRFFRLKSYLLLMLKNGNLDPFDFAVANDRAMNKIGKCSDYFSYLPSIENLDCLNLDKIKTSRNEIGLSIHYFRPSFNFYISINSMMKYPLEPYFNNFKNNGVE